MNLKTFCQNSYFDTLEIFFMFCSQLPLQLRWKRTRKFAEASRYPAFVGWHTGTVFRLQAAAPQFRAGVAKHCLDPLLSAESSDVPGVGRRGRCK